MSKLDRRTRDALLRMRAAFLDLQSAKRYTEANELLDLVERIEPPSARNGEAVGSTARPAITAGKSGPAPLPPVAPGPATYVTTYPGPYEPCTNCSRTLAMHCTTHLLPCCPGSLMHGQDEGSWTPAP